MTDNVNQRLIDAVKASDEQAIAPALADGLRVR